jgi:hypothetical protein
MMVLTQLSWGSLAEWASGLGSLAAVVTALYLADRETRLAQKRDVREMNELIDFASAVLIPFLDPAKSANDAQLEIDRACKDKSPAELETLELAVLPALRARRSSALSAWRAQIAAQSKVFTRFQRLISTRHVKLAAIIVDMSDLVNIAGEVTTFEDVRDVNARAETLSCKLTSLREQA